MFNNRKIVTAVDLGTSKICVLVGEILPNGNLKIIGHGCVPSGGAIVKGEICNMDKAAELLAMAMEEADRRSNQELNNSSLVVVPVTGCGIESVQGVGSALINSESQLVTDKECNEAIENAKYQQLSAGREIINISESWFEIDDRPVKNPISQSGRKLDAHVHIVHGVSSRVQNFKKIIRDCGFEDSVIYPAFAPLVTDYGILSEDERASGALLIDLGAGTTEYDVECNSVLRASGVIQVGFDHVCNDLAVGLDLKIGICRKIIEEGTLTRAIREHRDVLEFPGSKVNSIRRIPVTSFETIIDLRLREIFEIIKNILAEKNELNQLGAGGILTGGGAMFERTGAIFRDVFEMNCRIAQPLENGEPIPLLPNPRFCTAWGALRLAVAYEAMNHGNSRRVGLGGLLDIMDSAVCRIRKKFWTTK